MNSSETIFVRVPPVVTGSRITWLCAGCRRPIKRGGGALMVDHVAAMLRRHARREFDLNHPDGSDLAAYAREIPEKLTWVAWHTRCHTSDGREYWLGIDRIDSPLLLVQRAAHLAAKGWVGDTDWDQVLREAGRDAV